MSTDERELSATLVLEWYDGVVLGIVEPSWDRRPYVASLIAFDPDQLVRVLALFLWPIDRETEGASEAAVTAVIEACGRSNASALLVRSVGADLRVVNVREVPAASVAPSAGGDVEAALDPSRRHYLEDR